MRVQLQPAYLLHRRPFRDTSELLDVFCAEHGKLALVARGMSRRRRGGSLASILQPFRPLLLDFSGKGELLTLTGAESAGNLTALRGEALFSAFYLNELLLRLLPRFEAHPSLFLAYGSALDSLALAPDLASSEPALRRFEFQLLEDLGYAIDLRHAADTGRALEAGMTYRLTPEHGFCAALGNDDAQQLFAGEALLAIARGDFEPRVAGAAKRLVRALLRPHLGDSPLRTRAMFATRPAVAPPIPPRP